MKRKGLSVCIILTIFFSIPSLLLLPNIAPFLSSDVRSAAPKAISMLRREGAWIVNAELDHIEHHEEEICFVWTYRYRSRTTNSPPALRTTCIHEKH